jgi:hypothetical protein
MENGQILNSQSTATAPKLFRDRPRLATIKRKVTNGRRVFAVGGDGRGAWTRRWKDIVELHVVDAGGRDQMSEATLSLCRRAATLEIHFEQLECCMSQGDDVDIEIYGRIARHPGELYPRVGFIVTNMSRPAARSAAHAAVSRTFAMTFGEVTPP